MDAEGAYRLTLPSMVAFFRGLVANSPTSSLFAHDGVVAAIVPTAPGRSFLNSVLTRDRDALALVLDDLAERYERAGVNAWTVWVPREHTSTAKLLEDAGHHHDAAPRLMALEDLAGFDGDELEGVQWTREPDARQFAAVIDEGFEMGGEGFLQAIEDRLEIPGAHLYLAQNEGEPAATAMIIDAHGDAGAYAIATVPAARGRGLATGLLRQALSDARERGCSTSTLQATKAGFPIYDRLGYTNHGPIDMWERRKPR
jgi:GNAT superfamily N-acetyltransferase